MNEETINDFFKFTSTDKSHITTKDLENLEIFISKPDFEDMNESLLEFLNDLVFWCVNKLEVNVSFKEERQINLNANNQMKRRPTSNTNYNSYKMLYKKNLEFNRIKNSEVKRSLRNVIKYKNIDLKINCELLKNYFKFNFTYRELINKFMTRMHSIIITHELKLRQETVTNFYKNKKKKSRYNWKIYIGGDQESMKKTSQSRNGNNCVSKSPTDLSDEQKNNKSFTERDEVRSNIDKICSARNLEQIENNGDNDKSCLSDNEVILKTKVDFLKVLKNVTRNMAEQLQKEGKDVTIVRDSIPADDKLQTVIEQNCTFSNLKDDRPVVREQEISINLHDGKTKSYEDKQNYTKEKERVDKSKNNHGNNGNNKIPHRKKEECKCACLIF